MPRMVKLDEVKLVLVNVTLGRLSWRSAALLICCRSSAWALKADTAIGTRCSDSARRCAVTMMSVGSPVCCAER